MKLFDVYPLFDIEIKSGKGCYTYDTEGNEYLDLYGGHAVISIGHSHPYYINKITEQAQRLYILLQLGQKQSPTAIVR